MKSDPKKGQEAFLKLSEKQAALNVAIPNMPLGLAWWIKLIVNL